MVLESERGFVGEALERPRPVALSLGFIAEGRFAVIDDLDTAADRPRNRDTPMPTAFLLEDMERRG